MPNIEFKLLDTCPENIRPLFRRCIERMGGQYPQLGIQLALKGMKPAHQQSRYLAGRNSPKGEIVADADDDSQLVVFKADELLAWMVANQFVSMQEQDEVR